MIPAVEKTREEEKRLPGGAIRYLSPASYPFYILHLPAVVAVGYFAVQWDAAPGAKFLAISAGALAVTLLVYELLVRRIPVVGKLLTGAGPVERTLPLKPENLPAPVRSDPQDLSFGPELRSPSPASQIRSRRRPADRARWSASAASSSQANPVHLPRPRRYAREIPSSSYQVNRPSAPVKTRTVTGSATASP